MSRISAWLPTRVDGRIRFFAWLSLVTEIVIVGTGGAVRLTASGLGCPTWPTCTAQSLVPTPEMGVHGVIEFANRLMTGVVGLVAIATFVLLWRIRRERRDLFVLALVLALGVLVQALLGGVTVLTGLNPFIVGLHFIVSLLMVCVATVLVYRTTTTPGPRRRVVPTWFARLAHATSAVVAITIVVGVVTTASGPHSGDSDAVRSGFDAELFEHLHAWPAYVTLLLTVTLLAAAVIRGLPVAGWAVGLLGIEAMQIIIGLVQARTGLPPVLVGSHMVLACVLAAVMTALILHLRAPVAETDASPASATASAAGTARS
ncbi:heme A synthase [Cryobacterium sp. Sr8]|uniref:Cytochrome c oxidase assembly protein subunit 15 n=1 Tax=Cryobacterium psychrotolerans TaxID=386301 RepID=A0A1G8ZPR4_9MICO|nr:MULTISPECIES: COX15/CtaA family protein [Cryobacterium]TFD47445.1 heme A synthase [Cryobacterium sp. TMT1-2-1]TFD78093.1 heme A synthase [Cryobacterium sp. Sr8]TFD87483.1 heme A synthase [Cryobacterium psychrotolerans]SDK17013.1 cytochrome c oxidase assembly protein subunit 15 [Cryobacterium psychrotolerans]